MEQSTKKDTTDSPRSRAVARSFSKVATVLTWGGRVEDFERGIEVDDEFAHEGGKGDFGWFAFGNEALVEVLEDGIGATANQGAHVEGFSGSGASGADAAFAAQGSAVTVEGGDSCESGDGLAGNGSQFRQAGKEDGG